MDPNNQIESSGSGVPLKRKRGRPRKDPNLKHSGRPQIPPGFEASQQQNPPQTATAASPDPMIGQPVNGVIEASFDGGYLLSVKIGNSNASLRGVLFKPGQYVPVTTENDIAPHVPMIRREVGGGGFSTEPRSSSRGQKLTVQRAGTKHRHSTQTQANAVPVIHQPGNFQVGVGIVDSDDRDVHMVEPISMLPPDRIVPVTQLFSAVQTQANGSLSDGKSSEDGQAGKSKSKTVASAVSVDTTESSHFSDFNVENGKQASKSSGDSGLVFSKQDIGSSDVPFSKDSGAFSADLSVNFPANPSQGFSVATPFLSFGTGRMTDLLQAVQENVKDSALHVAEQPPSMSNVELHGTMASENDQLKKAGDP